MLDIKRSDISGIISEKEYQLKDIQHQLEFVKSVEKTSQWFDEFIGLLEKLKEKETPDILKKVMFKSKSYRKNMDGLVGFDIDWLKDIQSTISKIRRQLVPDRFHMYSYSTYNVECIREAKLEYSILYTATKDETITLLFHTMDSICAWCLHRLYVLDENPSFDS